MAGRRHAALTNFSQRLTPAEVAQHWFRRSRDYAAQIHGDHSDFPTPGPDGLYLADDVRTWFDCYHGKRQFSATRIGEAENRALEIARGGRG